MASSKASRKPSKTRNKDRASDQTTMVIACDIHLKEALVRRAKLDPELDLSKLVRHGLRYLEATDWEGVSQAPKLRLDS